MNEALLNFMGKTIADPEGMFLPPCHDRYETAAFRLQEETGIFTIGSHSAEGTSYRFARLDKERYGNSIYAANEENVRQLGADPTILIPVNYQWDIQMIFLKPWNSRINFRLFIPAEPSFTDF